MKPPPILADLDQPRLIKNRKMLRDRRACEPDHLDDLAHAQFPPPQRKENSDAVRIGKGF